MKIAVIGQKGFPADFGGIEKQVEQLCLYLAQNGHEFLVYARKWYSPPGNKTNLAGIKVIYTPSFHTKHLDAITHTFTSTIHALFQKPDVIHYHGVGPSLLSFMPRIFLPKTLVVSTFHCLDRYHKKWGWFARWCLKLGEWAACKFPHQTIAVSKTIQNYCLNEYHKLVTYIPNGVKPVVNSEQAELKNQGLTPNRYVMMVARMVSHKGAHYLIPAWRYVKKRYPQIFKNYKLVIVGSSVYTKKYVKDLHNLARGDASIVFTGWLSHTKLADLFDNASLIVHPSENEGMPFAVLQAMSHGKAVLVSNIPEHLELVANRNFWFDNASVDSLAKKLAELLPNEQLLKQVGRQNRQIIMENFNWQNIIGEIKKIYAFSDALKPKKAIPILKTT